MLGGNCQVEELLPEPYRNNGKTYRKGRTRWMFGLTQAPLGRQ